MEKKNINGLTEKEFLENYKPGDYDRPSVAVDILIFTVDKKTKNLELLLVKRKDHPFIDTWALPGGFVSINETAEEAAKRELLEETGIDNIYMEQLYTNSKVDRDPRMRVITIAYLALVDKESINPDAGDDAKEVAWFKVEKNPFNNDSLILTNNHIFIKYLINSNSSKCGNIVTMKEDLILDNSSTTSLAFDHIDSINTAITRMRGKLEYTNIAFNLLPEEFTFPELQSTYEIILGHPLYKASFRKQMQEKLIEVEKQDRTNNRRPAQVYKLR